MPLQRDVIHSMIRQIGKQNMRDFMLEYFKNEGKDEHQYSPHSFTDVRVLIDTILSDVEREGV